MKGECVPDSDHVLRHIKGRFIEGDEIDGGGFRLRETETELSFNWIEYYRTLTSDEQLQKIRDTFPLEVKKKDKFVKLNVGRAKNHVSREHPEGKVIDFIEDGDDEVPSHCLMTVVPEIDEMIGDLLVECILEVFPAIS